MAPRTATRSPAAADDQPFDFNLDAVKAESELRPFRFHWDGRRFEMQHSEALDIWQLLDNAEQGEIGATLGVFQAALGEQYKDFRAKPLPQWKMKALFDAYRAHCGLAEGESAASSSS
ncbi:MULTISPECIES: hypothetical protein [Streptomyces]|uniref:hypothetical protein n=1 Tax=Streptomyces lycopersici TaxID=2974589 RepID=UPI0021CED1E5|nr:hypothetical protein [Streptomyces sp. NEAU-383]